MSVKDLDFTPKAGLTPVREILGGVLKEVGRRAELRQRLEAEGGGPISDEEFIQHAEKSGLRI